jgi:hypothetical protein
MVLETLHVSGPSESSDRNRMDEYVGVVQADIHRALKKAGGNKRGEYRIALKLWVAPLSRIVERAELDGSTGDQDRDSTIAEALRGMTLSQQAPPNMPRPIRFMISIHTF